MADPLRPLFAPTTIDPTTLLLGNSPLTEGPGLSPRRYDNHHSLGAWHHGGAPGTASVPDPYEDLHAHLDQLDKDHAEPGPIDIEDPEHPYDTDADL